MSKARRYKHPFVDGMLVTDPALGETFVFLERRDGQRAELQQLRAATPEEQATHHRQEVALASAKK